MSDKVLGLTPSSSFINWLKRSLSWFPRELIISRVHFLLTISITPSKGHRHNSVQLFMILLSSEILTIYYKICIINTLHFIVITEIEGGENMCGKNCCTIPVGNECLHGHSRRFFTKEEKIKQLEEYKKELNNEIKAIEEIISEIK